MAELGRNAPCWCGSGKKYKNCHLGRENEQEMKLSEYASKFKKLHDIRTCLHPQAGTKTCQGKIIRAHSVQNAEQLSKIAKNGHVYGYKLGISTILNPEWSVKLELIGINNASTFTGFCQKHDTEIFKSIETEPITLTKKQLFLFGYRAICMEYYKKQVNQNVPQLLREQDKGKDLYSQQMIQSFASYFEAESSKGFNDLEISKLDYDNAMIKNDYSHMNYAVFEFNELPVIMTSGAFLIEIDFHNNKLQDLEQLDNLIPLTFSLVSTETGGAAIFVWFTKNNEVFKTFFDSLIGLGNDMIPHAILRMIFDMLENVYISPEWFDKQSESVKNRIQIKFTSYPTKEVDYSDDGIRMVDWQITNILTKYKDAV